MAIKAKKIQQSKVEAIGAEKERIQAAGDFIFTEYRGLTVEQISALRRQLREKKATYHVVKNNFARIAFEELEYPALPGIFTGPTAVAYARGNPNEVAKILLDFAKEAPAVKIKGGMVGRGFFDAKQVEALSKLPGRDQLIAMLMSTMNAPMQNLVFALNAIPSKLVRTVKAVADKKASQGA
jgi:large subunit ribosomal protein L10